MLCSTVHTKHSIVPNIGAMVSEVVSDQVYLTSDKAKNIIESRVPLPAVDWNQIKSCTNKTDQEITALKVAERKYKQRILAELNLSEAKTQIRSSSNEIENCLQEGKECIFKATQVVSHDQKSMQYLPCTNFGDTYLSDCGGENTVPGGTMCCPLTKRDSFTACNLDSAMESITEVLKWKSHNNRDKISINNVLSSVRRVHGVCISLTHKDTSSGLVPYISDKINSTLLHHSGKYLHEVLSIKSRKRRSNLKYYLSGGMFTSNYIDSEIHRIEQSDQLSFHDLQMELKKTNNAVLSLSNERQALKDLNDGICSTESELSEALVKQELLSTQARLFDETENAVSTCEANNSPPSKIQTSLLESICKSLTDSANCYRLHIRQLFDCKLESIHFDQATSTIRILWFGYRYSGG